MNLLTTLNLALQALITLANAYAKSIEINDKRKDESDIEKLEDEIDSLAANGSPAAKLRMEKLSKRLSHKRERIARSRDNPLP